MVHYRCATCEKDWKQASSYRQRENIKQKGFERRGISGPFFTGRCPVHTYSPFQQAQEAQWTGPTRPLCLPPLLPLLHLCLRPRTASLELLSGLKPKVIMTSCPIMINFVYMQTFYVLTASC
jgi:hypothetical protein